MRAWLGRFAGELFLYSGQYALFYLLMNLSQGAQHLLKDGGHLVLFAALIGQTALSASLTGRPLWRAASVFTAPVLYTLYDAPGTYEWLYNIGHLFFWIFSAAIALFLALAHRFRQGAIKAASEAAITFTNIAVFVFIYFYFDLKLALNKQVNQGLIDAAGRRELLEIYNIHLGFAQFLADPAHLYIIFGGLFLGLTIAYSRMQNLRLTDRIDRLLTLYLDAGIKERVVADPEASERRDLVLLFCDIRNFTAVSEVHAPDKIVGTLNEYYGGMAEIIARHGGIINKFIGDAVLVIFGLKNNGNPKEQAVLCAQAMIGALEEINRRLQTKGLPGIDNIGIGIHGGEVVLGAIGSRERKDYTVIGDAVNTASRLETLCKTHGKNLIVSKTVFDALSFQTQSRFVFLENAALKGKADKIAAYAYRGEA
ncbi:MAG: adenylate/guanylate cyclase domain-containing protein [Campylobacterales bacterium]